MTCRKLLICLHFQEIIYFIYFVIKQQVCVCVSLSLSLSLSLCVCVCVSACVYITFYAAVGYLQTVTGATPFHHHFWYLYYTGSDPGTRVELVTRLCTVDIPAVARTITVG